MNGPDRELLRDAIDMHAHTHPALFDRPIDDADMAQLAIDYGMRGFVLKDHDQPTTGRAYHVSKIYSETTPYGAVVLNRSVGGINPWVAQSALHYGAKMIFMPSNHSKWHAEYFDTPDYPQLGRKQKQLPGEGVTILDASGQLTAEAKTVVELVAGADACLATGHLSLTEIRLLLDAANAAGVQKFLVTHANWALCRLDLDVQRELIAKGAYMEYVAVSCCSPIFWEQKPDELAEWIQTLGGSHLVLSSDLGQASAPPHPEGMRMLIRSLLDVGTDYDNLEQMTKHNPATLLGLSS